MHSDRSRLVLGWVTRGVAAIAACGLIAISRRHSMPPTPAVLSSATTFQAERGRGCVDCHPSHVESMQDAPHWNTLTPAGESSVRSRFSGTSFHSGVDGVGYEFFERPGELWVRSSRVEKPLRLHWVFGSGSHAQTPVSVQRNARAALELIEHRVSWYPNHGLGHTLGQDDGQEDASDVRRLGLEYHGTRHPEANSLNCFGCHASQFNPGRLEFPDGAAPGLGCLRCHVGGDGHAREQQGAAQDASETNADEAYSWSGLSARESVNRCGECHRRADQIPEDEIRTSAEHIVRFASVGLVQSECFLRAEQSTTLRLDCTTCHDPHRAASKDPAFYASRCRECHAAEAETGQTVCSVEPVGDRCVDCHMPKRETLPGLRFTDHWIRRDAAEPGDGVRQ